MSLQRISYTIFYLTSVGLMLANNPYSAESDIRRHNLKSVDVRFWRLKYV